MEDTTGEKPTETKFGKFMAASQSVLSLPSVVAVMGVLVLYGGAMLQSFADNPNCEINGGWDTSLINVKSNRYKNGTLGLFAASLFILIGFFQKMDISPLAIFREHQKLSPDKKKETIVEWTNEFIWFVLVFAACLPVFLTGWASVVTSCAPFTKDVKWDTSMPDGVILTQQGQGVFGSDCIEKNHPSECQNSSYSPVAILFGILMSILAYFSFDKFLRGVGGKWSFFGDSTDNSRYSSSGQVSFHSIGSGYALLDSSFRFLAFVFITVLLKHDPENKDDSYAYDYDATFQPGDFRATCGAELEGLGEKAIGEITPLDNETMRNLAYAALAFTTLEMVIRLLEFFDVAFSGGDKFVKKMDECKANWISGIDLFRLICCFSRTCAAVFMIGFIFQNSLWMCPAYKPSGIYHTAMFFLFMVPSTAILQLLRTNHKSASKGE